MVFGSQQTATLLTVFEYKKCDQNRKNFCHLKLNISRTACTRVKIQKEYEFYLHHLYDAIKKNYKKINLKFLLICLTKAIIEDDYETNGKTVK